MRTHIAHLYINTLWGPLMGCTYRNPIRRYVIRRTQFFSFRRYVIILHHKQLILVQKYQKLATQKWKFLCFFCMEFKQAGSCTTILYYIQGQWIDPSSLEISLHSEYQRYGYVVVRIGVFLAYHTYRRKKSWYAYRNRIFWRTTHLRWGLLPLHGIIIQPTISH